MQQHLLRLINTENVKIGLLFYLQNSPTQSLPTNKIEPFFSQKLWLVPLSDRITAQGFTNIVGFMAKLIKKAVELAV